jgi:hypothetical protein
MCCTLGSSLGKRFIVCHDAIFRQEQSTGEITFYMKGADMVMNNIVQYNDWLEEEVIF